MQSDDDNESSFVCCCYCFCLAFDFAWVAVDFDVCFLLELLLLWCGLFQVQSSIGLEQLIIQGSHGVLVGARLLQQENFIALGANGGLQIGLLVRA